MGNHRQAEQKRNHATVDEDESVRRDTVVVGETAAWYAEKG